MPAGLNAPPFPNVYNMNTKVVYVPSSCVGILIGRSGETIRDLQQRSGAYIKVTPDHEAVLDDPERIIYISGPPQALELAHSLVNDVINEGLNRSYRDGVEPGGASTDVEGPRVPSEGNEGSAAGHTEEAAVVNVPRDSAAESTTSGHRNIGSEGNVQRAGQSRDTRASSAEVDAQKKVGFESEVDVDREESWDASSSGRLGLSFDEESSRHEGVTGSTAQESREISGGANRSSGGDEGEEVEIAGGDEEEEEDDEPNPFAGEGRWIQRPASYYPSASITFEMKIPDAKVGVIIGKRGATIRLLQQNSGARIVVSKKMDTSRKDNPRAVTITGPKPFVEKARRLIVARINPQGGEVIDDAEMPMEGLELDERILGDDVGMDALGVEFAGQSLSNASPLGPNSPSPMSPMRIPLTPPFTNFQRQMLYVGTGTAGPYGSAGGGSSMDAYRAMMQTESGEVMGGRSDTGVQMGGSQYGGFVSGEMVGSVGYETRMESEAAGGGEMGGSQQQLFGMGGSTTGGREFTEGRSGAEGIGSVGDSGSSSGMGTRLMGTESDKVGEEEGSSKNQKQVGAM